MGSQKQKRSRAHHYVPQFHLRQFGIEIDEARTIWVLDTRTGMIKRQPIATTAVRTDYHTVVTAAGPSDSIEVTISKIEGEAATAIRMLLSAGPGRIRISPEIKRSVATYVGLLYTRVPASRRRTEAFAEEVGNFMFELGLRHTDGFALGLRRTGWRGSDDEADQLRRQWLADSEAGRGRFRAMEAASLQDLDVGISLAPVIEDMAWTLVTVQRWPYFILGDAPVTLWASSETPGSGPVGLLTVGAELAVPLRPETTLVASFRRSFDYHLVLDTASGFEGPTAQALRFGYRSFVSADRFVFGRSRSDLQATAAFASTDRQHPDDEAWDAEGDGFTPAGSAD